MRLHSRAALLVGLLALVAARPAVAAQPSVIATSTKTATVSNETIAITTTMANQSIGVWYIMTSAGNRVASSVTSDLDGAFPAAVVSQAACGAAVRCVSLHVKHNVSVGAHTLTIDQSGVFIGYDLAAFAFQCSGACATDVTDGTASNGSGLTHPAASGSGINTAANVLVTAACVLNASASSVDATKPTNWQTDRTNLTLQSLWAYEDDVATAFTNETATFEIVTTSRTSLCAIASIVDATVAPSTGSFGLGFFGR